MGGECRAVRPLGAAVEGDRAAQVRRYLFEALDESGEGGVGGVAVGHGDRDVVAGSAFAEPDHQERLWVPMIRSGSVAGLAAVVERGRAPGDVRPGGTWPGVSGAPVASVSPPGAQALVRFDAERAAVDGLVEGLSAGPARDLLGGEVRQIAPGERPWRTRRRPGPAAAQAPPTAAAGVRDTARRRGRPPGRSSSDHGSPGGQETLNSPPGPQSAQGESPRVRATPAVRVACWHLHRSVRELAPVIMTGTVHRPMELADLDGSDEMNPEPDHPVACVFGTRS